MWNSTLALRHCDWLVLWIKIDAYVCHVKGEWVTGENKIHVRQLVPLSPYWVKKYLQMTQVKSTNILETYTCPEVIVLYYINVV